MSKSWFESSKIDKQIKNIYTNKLTLGFLLIKLKLAMLIMNSKKICKVMVILQEEQMKLEEVQKELEIEDASFQIV